MLAIEDELRAHAGQYDAIVLATLPPGISRWLRMDIHSQVARRFDIPVISVAARPASMPEVPSLARYTVAEVMHSDVAAVGSERPMEELITDIADVQYGCFVAVDEDQAPVGIITEGDIIRLALAEQIPGGTYLREILSSVDAGVRHARAHADTVADFMTTPVTTVPFDDRLQRVAETFAESDFHRLPVVQDGALVGLVRRIDLMGPILQVHEEIQQQRRAEGGRAVGSRSSGFASGRARGVLLRRALKRSLHCMRALVAQWIEHLPPEQGAAGSNPAEGTSHPLPVFEVVSVPRGRPP